MKARAIDAWVNVNMTELGRPDYLVQVASRYFKQGEDFFRNYEIGEMLELMDAASVERVILTTDAERPSPHVMKFAEQHPERFALGVHLDPRRGGTVSSLHSQGPRSPAHGERLIRCRGHP